MKYIFLQSFLFSIIFGYIGCTTLPLKPLENDKKITIALDSLCDLTGQYRNLSPSMETLFPIALSPEYIEAIEYDNVSGNNNSLKIYQNLLLPIQSNKSVSSTYKLKGDVELVEYGTAKDIDERIINFHYLGVFGFLLTNNNDMAAHVQYRFYLANASGIPVDSFLVMGISSGDPLLKSRRQLMGEANSFAMFELRQMLLHSIADKNNINLDYKITDRFSDEHAATKRIELINELLLNKR